MSHFVESMVFTNENPWHFSETGADGRAVKVSPEDATSWERFGGLARLRWGVEKEPIWYRKADGSFEPLRGQYTITRDDIPLGYMGDGIDKRTGEQYGENAGDACTVGRKYTCYQNDMAGFSLEALIKASQGEMRFETAGALMGGRKVWALLQVAGETIIRTRHQNVSHVPFLLAAWSHDGSSTVLLKHTSVCVVCWNTFSAAERGGEKGLRIRHTASVVERVDEALRILGYVAEEQAAHAETLQALADTPMDTRSFVTFASQLLTGEDDPEKALEAVAKSEGRSRTMLERKGDTLTQLFVAGMGTAGALAR
jgi:phage/plasmid-like protein (TIGR03299 family)